MDDLIKTVCLYLLEIPSDYQLYPFTPHYLKAITFVMPLAPKGLELLIITKKIVL